jgi:hypothetical protein
MRKEQYKKALSQKVLADCRPDWAFWVCNGQVLRNIHELASAIENMNDGTFFYHVNDENNKNDFAQWILDVIQDGELAHKLKKIRNRKRYGEIIRARIKELERH